MKLDAKHTTDQILERMIQRIHASYERQCGPTSDANGHRKPKVIKGKLKVHEARLRREGKIR